MDIDLTPRRILLIIAAIIFVLAAIGSWPDSLRDDIEPVALASPSSPALSSSTKRLPG